MDYAKQTQFIRAILWGRAKPCDIDDIAQEVIVAQLKRGQDDVLNLKTWLTTCARRTAINHYRRKKQDELMEEITGECTPDYSDLHEALATLANGSDYEKRQAQVAQLHYFDGESVDDISKILKLPIGTVKRTLFVLRENLRGLLEL